MNAYSCKPSDHPYDAGMHTLMCIAVLTSGICSDEYCTVHDMNMRPSRGNCLVSDSRVITTGCSSESIPFLRAQGAQAWDSGYFAISSIDNGLSSSDNGAYHLLGPLLLVSLSWRATSPVLHRYRVGSVHIVYSADKCF